jgi:hypothetical protein
MRRVRAEVADCGGGKGGILNVTMEISGRTGRVRSSEVTRGGYSVDVGTTWCVEKALSKACFAPFEKKSFRLLFPFKVK